jgi:glc operon protein GlcG
MNTHSKIVLASIFAIGLVAAASAQQAPAPPPAIPYGAPIAFEAAKKVMAAAEAEAMKNNWSMAIAILDSTGHVVMLHRFDNTQYGSIAVAEDKARSALDYRRPTKVFEDLVAQGGIGLRTLALRGASPLEGDKPWLVSDLLFLEIAARRGMSLTRIASFLGREVGEVRDEARKLENLLGKNDFCMVSVWPRTSAARLSSSPSHPDRCRFTTLPLASTS